MAQPKRLRWRIFWLIFLFFVGESKSIKFYTGNVTAPLSMKEIFINPIDDAVVTTTDGISQTIPVLPRLDDEFEANSTLKSLKMSKKIDFSLLCAEGIPLLREDDLPKRCNPDSVKPENGCPKNFWCHIGKNDETNFCCPSNKKTQNLCYLSPNSGYGTDKITRYWYDWRAGYCRNMVYTGFGGNENNFVTRQKCENHCNGTKKPENAESKVVVEKVKPEPLITTTKSSVKLSTTMKNMPKPIKISEISTTTIKNENSSNPCKFPPEKGQKSLSNQKSIIRWYFDLAAEKCVQFNFFGFHGNENNFENEKICMEICGGGLRKLDSCLFSMNVGFGQYSIPRFYFNDETKSCRKFMFRGNGGNSNRFASKSTCEDVCIKGIPTFHSRKIPKPTNSSKEKPKLLFLTNNPLTMTSEMIKNINDLDKFTIDPDPFAISPLTTTQNFSISSPTAAQKVGKIFEKIAEENEESVDPFELSAQTLSNFPEFPISKPPFEIDEKNPDPFEFPDQNSRLGVLLVPETTTTAVVDFPTLVSIVETKNKTSETVKTLENLVEVFQSRFGKLGTTTKAPDAIDGRPYSAVYGVTPKFIPELFGMNQLPISQPENPALMNPCLFVSSVLSTFQKCQLNGNENGKCTGETFCQFGATIDQNFCCPKLGGNPCLQQKTAGVGTAQLQRWNFDVVSNQCRGFIFYGFQGNENSFLSYDECQKNCQAVNPCPYGFPAFFDGTQTCSITQKSCPEMHYCQILENQESVCCPLFNGTVEFPRQIPPSNHGSPLVGIPMGHSRRPMSPCSMAVTSGNGRMTLHRWAYSPAKKSCVTFVYTGIAGNQNNFLTRSDCINACVASVNPCGGALLVFDSSQIRKCTSKMTCGTGFYCHFGGTEDSNVCCPSNSVHPCLLALNTGSGSAVLHRYYFDAISSTCKAFTYTGIGGNENNFITVQDCRRTCPEYSNPCPKGKPPIDSVDGSVAFCSAANPTCPKNYFCHIGDARQTTVCCPFVGHPCSAGVVLGSGTAQLPRYYYNSKTRSCVPFVYSGKGGNSNNFVSKVDCEISCPVLDNPCTSGFPALDSYGEPVFCSTADSSCPKSHFCHIGASQSTTVCCPGSNDPCRLPMSRGTGTAVLNRWYFNTEGRVCVSFVYSGRGGNQNNFISRQECLATCPEFISPCPEGQPHIGLSGQITHCGATDPSSCPTTFWCHIGETLENSVCCPGSADPCDQEVEIGTGSSQLLRYHYNQLTRACSQFRYSGLGGNENNFLTKASCEARCPVFISPCAAGAPEMDPSLAPIACSAADNTTCSPGFWCHIGATEQTTICCSGATLEICNEPRVIGTGDASLPRYYYNPLTKQCLPFIYAGGGGNQNNFLSRVSCESTCEVLQNPCVGGDPATGSNGLYITCSSNSPNVCPAGYWCHVGGEVTDAICCPGAEDACSLPSAAGRGDYSLTRWYFDANLQRCAKFTYSGVGGNQNNFMTLQDCQLKCPEFQSPCSSGDPAQAPIGGILFCSPTQQNCPSNYWCHIGANSESTVCCPDSGDPCLSAMLPGSGFAKLSRWYFSQNTRQCLQFTYTGSGGNANNFLSEGECAAKCPVFRNPCPNVLNSNQLTIVKCSAQNPQSCPSGWWCHYGATADMSVCCPGASDPCRLRFNQGTLDIATGPFTRWYYDFTSRICKAFQYGGRNGNENNFLTKEDCVQRCPEFVNPCFTGEPLIETLTGMVRFCNSRNSVGCPSGYYCHYGANADTTVCCPSDRNPCSQALAVGIGSASLVRWYFNSQSRLCQEFVYTGIGGNANNFVSRAACAQTCPEFTNPCGEGQPLTSIGGQVTYCSFQNRYICPKSYYCHIGAAADSSVCCPGPMNPCTLTVAIGRGSSSLMRYYFNQFTRTCEQFIYSGFGGNANNFVSLAACRQTCPEFNPISNNFMIQPRLPFNSRIHRHPRIHNDDNEQLSQKLCPQGNPLMENSEIPRICDIQKADSCPNKFVCTLTTSGNAFCCPDPRDFCLKSHTLTTHCPSASNSVMFSYNPMTDTCQRSNSCDENSITFKNLNECSRICCNKGYNLRLKFDDDSTNVEPQILEFAKTNSKDDSLDTLMDEFEESNSTIQI